MEISFALRISLPQHDAGSAMHVSSSSSLPFHVSASCVSSSQSNRNTRNASCTLPPTKMEVHRPRKQTTFLLERGQMCTNPCWHHGFVHIWPLSKRKVVFFGGRGNSEGLSLTGDASLCSTEVSLCPRPVGAPTEQGSGADAVGQGALRNWLRAFGTLRVFFCWLFDFLSLFFHLFLEAATNGACCCAASTLPIYMEPFDVKGGVLVWTIFLGDALSGSMFGGGGLFFFFRHAENAHGKCILLLGPALGLCFARCCALLFLCSLHLGGRESKEG